MTGRIFTALGMAVLMAGCGKMPERVQAAASQPAETQAVPSTPRPASENGPRAATGSADAVHVVVVPAGTRVHLRLDQELDTRRNRRGDRFHATLAAPVVAGGQVVIPKGTLFSGRVVVAKPSGRLKGRARLGLELDSFELRGATYRVVTGANGRTSGSHRKRNLALIGGGSGFGAVVGAVAGGGAGALIGAGAGSAAGAAGAFITGRKNVSLPAETQLVFSLRHNVAVRT